MKPTIQGPDTVPDRLTRWLVWLSVIAGLLAVLAVLVPGPGYRFGLFGLGVAFTTIRWGAYAGLAAFIIALVGGILLFMRGMHRGRLLVIIGLLAGITSFGVPWHWVQKARSVPFIHDITTDTVTPPVFVALAPLRKDAPNGITYGGHDVAILQQRAYPDIKPVIVNDPPLKVFNASLAVAKKMGWEIVAAQPGQGRIEATSTTFWFGFKDDVVIRIRPDGPKTRLDIRSESRVGKSDLGKNADRIRRFVHDLQDRLQT